MSNAPPNSALNANAYARAHRVLAWLWLLFLLFSAGSLLFRWQELSARVDTDLLTLLPKDERHPALESALKSLAAQGEKQLALLVSARDEAAARQAAALARETLSSLGMTEQKSSAATFPGDFYFPYRQGLLTDADRHWLGNATPPTPPTPQVAANRALNLAYSLFTPESVPWQSDPYGFFGDWLKSLGEATPLRPIEGELMLEREGRFYVALIYQLPQSAFDADFQQRLTEGLDKVGERIRAADADAGWLRAGVALHAAAATRQAEGEMSLIGFGSLAGIFLLIGFVFQSARALKLIALSLVSGATLALMLAFLLFERVHLLTLVFGASLIGVAVDYAILVFAQHLGSEEPVWERYRRLLPTLCIVLVTPAFAYCALALTPFPGLKQMAVFAVSGISGAWISVVAFYPYLLPATLPQPGNAQWMKRLLDSWPRWCHTKRVWCLFFCLLVFMAGGLAKLRVNDDIRSLFNGDATLMNEQRQVSEILNLPSPAQMFLIEAESPELLLQREEALIERLRPLMAAGRLAGFEAASRWSPSLKRQREARDLQENLKEARALLAAELELSADWRDAVLPEETLTPEIWLADNISLPFRALWLGEQKATETGSAYASMVLLKGLADRATADELETLADEAAGVAWVNQTVNISSLMARYRQLLTRVLLLACVVVPLLLYPFFRRDIWRVVMPVMMAGALTLALMGYLDIPIQLLSIIALLLVLGMGVDYAVFLQARQNHAHTLLATTLAASLTLLSFGLLALSGTPALHALGMTSTLGVLFSWLFTPVFLQKPP